MNWTDKAKEIADGILEEMEDGSYTRDDVIDGLMKAAMKGMAFECENWMNNKR